MCPLTFNGTIHSYFTGSDVVKSLRKRYTNAIHIEAAWKGGTVPQDSGFSALESTFRQEEAITRSRKFDFYSLRVQL